MPSTSRDFRRAAGQRLAAAETLFAADLTLDAYYVGGYVVECSLKAMILEATPAAGRSHMLRRISRGASMHRYDVLRDVFRGVGGRCRSSCRVAWSGSIGRRTFDTRSGDCPPAKRGGCSKRPARFYLLALERTR